MAIVGRVAKLAGFGVGVALALVLVGFGVLQTGAAKRWLAGEIGRSLSAPGASVTVSGLEGTVPFHLRVGAIVFADAAGPRMRITDADVAISARDLLAGRLVIEHLAARRIDIERPAASSSSSSGSDAMDLFNPPLPVTLQHLDIGALALGEPVLGTAITVAVTGSGDLGGGRAAADLALSRIDGTAGAAKFHLALGGTPLTLGLDAEVSEPTGTVLAGMLHRDDKLPLHLTLKGDGPLDHWQGNLSLAAGDAASATARIAIAGSAPYRLTLTGAAQVAALLPPALKPLAEGGIDIAAEAVLDDKTAVLQKLELASKGAQIAAQGRYGQADGALSATASVTLGDLAPLGSLAGIEIAGAGHADLSLDGTLARPSATVTLRLDRVATAQGRVAAASATLALAAEGDPRTAPVALQGSGTLTGIAPASGALPAGLGDSVDWRIAATLDAPRETVTAGTIELHDAGATLSGSTAASLAGATGELRLTIADLAPFAGGAVSGTADVTASFSAGADGSATAVLSGEIGQAKSGTAELDRALGLRATIGGTVRRLADGTIEASDLAIEGAAVKITAAGSRAPDGIIGANFSASLPRLAALDPRLAGTLSAKGEIAGPADALGGTVTIAAPSLAAAGVKVDALSLRVALARLMPLDARLEGKLRINGIDTVVRLVAAQAGQVIHVKGIELSAAGARIDGTADIAGSRIDGRLHGRMPDLRPFSALAGMPLAGRATFDARAAGQRYELTLDATGLGAAGATAQRVHVAGEITDPFAKPSGRVEATVTGLAAGKAEIGTATLSAKSGRAGRFTLAGAAHGKLVETFALSVGADVGIERGAVDLRLEKFAGSVGGIAWTLGAPAAATWHGTNGRFSGLVLKLGSGSLIGDGALDGGKIALHLVARNLPVHALAELGGQSAEGDLGFELTLAGTRAAPEGKLVVDGEELRFAAASRPDLPALGLVMNADWRQGKVTVQGRLAGPQGAAIGWQGSAPLVLDPQALAIHLPKDGAVAFHLEGDGHLEALADLLPLGEDRIAGRFNVDVRVAGTVGNPLASGRAAVTGGRYESLAAGAALSNVEIVLVGDREKLVLQKFAAGDGEGGTLSASGAVELAAVPGPALNFSAELTRFHGLKRDEISAAASGKLNLSGPITAPKLAAALTIDEADIAVPDKLPQTLRPVEVVKINSATGKILSPLAPPHSPVLVAVALDVTIAMPGKVFVRGRGLDSEWRGRVSIAGTSRQPIITGRIQAVRGTFDFIGTTFVVTKGDVTFLGGSSLDPTIAIVTQAQSNDITAIVAITGLATQPHIKLSSQPDLPRDEILSRLLFGTGMNQITAAQGLQLAGAVASLAGGDGLDVLAKLRKRLGLDRLSLGSAGSSVVPGVGVPSLGGTPGLTGQTASGPASGIGTTPLGPTGNASTALSAGKYVASGVYVGVSQGTDASSSTVTVQVDVAPHVTIATEAGQQSGTGIGINWKLDY